MSEQYLLSVQDLHTVPARTPARYRLSTVYRLTLTPAKSLALSASPAQEKSVTAYSVMQILADNGSIKSGHILYKRARTSRHGPKSR